MSNRELTSKESVAVPICGLSHVCLCSSRLISIDEGCDTVALSLYGAATQLCHLLLTQDAFGCYVFV